MKDAQVCESGGGRSGLDERFDVRLHLRERPKSVGGRRVDSIETHHLSKDTLQEDLHDNSRIWEDGSDDLSLLADRDANLVVEVGESGLRLRCR